MLLKLPGEGNWLVQVVSRPELSKSICSKRERPRVRAQKITTEFLISFPIGSMYRIYANIGGIFSLAPMKVRGLTKRLKSSLEHGRVSVFLVFTR